MAIVVVISPRINFGRRKTNSSENVVYCDYKEKSFFVIHRLNIGRRVESQINSHQQAYLHQYYCQIKQGYRVVISFHSLYTADMIQSIQRLCTYKQYRSFFSLFTCVYIYSQLTDVFVRHYLFEENRIDSSRINLGLFCYPLIISSESKILFNLFQTKNVDEFVWFLSETTIWFR